MPTDPDRYRNFRLRGIPCEYQSRADVRELVKSVLSIGPGASLAVHSLATSPVDRHSKIATLSFNSLPDRLSDSSANEWEFELCADEAPDGDDFGQKRSLVFDTHFTGFTPLQRTTDDECHLDVIAISGLGGHAFGSFKARQGSFMWLRDALPLDVPGARILIYGYNTRLVRSSSLQNLTDLGRALQVDMKGIRESNPTRPIVFIGHSLGGLVIKEAIVKFKEEMDKEGTSILNAISGYLFFGVPHQGMAIESLVPLVKGNPNRGLLESLNKNSALLLRLEKEFRNTFNTRCPQIISFYETVKSPTAVEIEEGKWDFSGRLEVLVDGLSATCGSKNQHPVNRNHSEMVKFSNQYDELYTRVRIILRPLVDRQIKHVVGMSIDWQNTPVTLSDEHKECLRSLSFREQEYRYNGIHPARDTCEWLLDDAQYQTWINNTRGLFWIKGNPGAGKSVLMKFAVKMMNLRKSGELVLSFFIHGRGTHLQKTPLGIFRALLNSMLQFFPEYLSQLTKKFEDREARFGSYQMKRWDWDDKELQEFMFEVLTTGTKNRPVVIFVDALDECGEDHAKSLLAYFKRLMKDAEREEAQVKICFSSRHYPILGLDTIPTLSVEERNDKDIRLIIHDRLEEIQPRSKRQHLENEILLKAQGGFQWAVLVAAIVIEGNATGIKPEKLQEKLATTPEALDELYTDILSGVTRAEKNQMVKLFQWVLFAERPLSAQELRDALATDKDMACTTIAELRSHENWVDGLSQFEARVKHISRGLVEFQTREIWEQFEPGGEGWDREAQFLHQSVADYMLKKFLYHAIDYQYTSQSQIGAGHFEISRSCLRYLTLKEVLEGARLSRTTLSTRFPLLPYAVRFLFDHIQKVEKKGIPQLDLLSLIRWDSSAELLREIASLWRIFDPNSAHSPMGWPFIGATPLHVLAAFGSKSAFDALLQRNGMIVDGRDSDGNTPLILAIREGHQDIALALLDRSMEWQLRHDQATSQSISQAGESGPQMSHFVDVDAENNDGETPLTIALTEKAGNVIFKLIEAGAALKLFGRESELVFYTIRNRNKSLFMKLIEGNVNLDGAVYFTLEELSHEGDDVLKDILSELLKAGANTRKSQEIYNSSEFDSDEDEAYEEEEADVFDDAILLASRDGHAAIVSLLLSYGASVTYRSEYGKFPLVLAVENGHEEVVKILLQNVPSESDVEDFGGLTALQVAVQEENEAMVKLLLETDMFNSDLVNAYGGKLLLRLASGEGVEAIVKLFVETGKVDVNLQDGDVMTALIFAGSEGHENIVKLLLETGKVDVNLQNEDGMTALIFAVSGGHENIVKLLLETGKVDVNLQNEIGTTALICAVSKGHENIVKLLLETSKIDVNLQDEDGITALIFAVLEGHENIAKLLLETSKVNVNLQNKDGTTALIFAVLGGHENIVKLLLETSKIDVNLQDEDGMTALIYAISEGHENIAKLLLETSKVNVNLQNEDGMTALICAVSEGHENIVKLLLETDKIDIDLDDNLDQTALSWAIQKGEKSIVKLLLETGKCNVNSIDNCGQTPLLWALEKSQGDEFKLLLEAGKVDLDLTDSDVRTLLSLAERKEYYAILKLLRETSGWY